MVIVECPSEANAVEEAVDVVLWGSDIKELNGGKLFENIVRGDGEALCEVEEGDDFEDPKDRGESEELDSATRTFEYSGYFEKPREGDRKMCSRQKDSVVLDGDLYLL